MVSAHVQFSREKMTVDQIDVSYVAHLLGTHANRKDGSWCFVALFQNHAQAGG